MDFLRVVLTSTNFWSLTTCFTWVKFAVYLLFTNFYSHLHLLLKINLLYFQFPLFFPATLLKEVFFLFIVLYECSYQVFSCTSSSLIHHGQFVHRPLSVVLVTPSKDQTVNVSNTLQTLPRNIFVQFSQYEISDLYNNIYCILINKQFLIYIWNRVFPIVLLRYWMISVIFLKNVAFGSKLPVIS